MTSPSISSVSAPGRPESSIAPVRPARIDGVAAVDREREDKSSWKVKELDDAYVVGSKQVIYNDDGSVFYSKSMTKTDADGNTYTKFKCATVTQNADGSTTKDVMSAHWGYQDGVSEFEMKEGSRTF